MLFSLSMIDFKKKKSLITLSECKQAYTFFLTVLCCLIVSRPKWINFKESWGDKFHHTCRIHMIRSQYSLIFFLLIYLPSAEKFVVLKPVLFTKPFLLFHIRSYKCVLISLSICSYYISMSISVRILFLLRISNFPLCSLQLKICIPLTLSVFT